VGLVLGVGWWGWFVGFSSLAHFLFLCKCVIFYLYGCCGLTSGLVVWYSVGIMAKGKGRKDEMTVQDFLEGGVALAWALSEALGAVHVAIVAVLQYGDRVEQFREMADLVQAVAKEHGQEMLRLGAELRKLAEDALRKHWVSDGAKGG
jgi:hypothetical protein